MDTAFADAKSAPSKAGLGYFAAVDGLRAIAVLTVIVFHLDRRFLPGGFVGVDIFFVISGFVVTSSLAHLQFANFRSLLAYFYARRLVRIMPALCVCLLLAITAYVVLIPSSWLSNLTERTAAAAFVGLSNVVLAFNNDTYFAPTSEYNPFLHTWSLGVEEQFYLLFPFLLYFHGRARRSAAAERRSFALIAGIGIASLLACIVMARIDQKFAFYLLPFRFWELALGMILALYLPRLIARGGGLNNAVVHGAATLAAILLVWSVCSSEAAGFPFPLPFVPALATAITIAVVCTRERHWSARILANRPFVWIGLRSYSLYLWHWPVFVMMRWTCGIESVEHKAVALVLTFVLGHLSYEYVEQPFRTSGFLRGLARWKVAIGGVAAAGVVAVGGLALLKAQPMLSISRTAHGEWFANDKSPLLPGPPGCELSTTRRPIADGSLTIWRRTGCAPANHAGRLFVIGNSHALGYRPMLRQFVLDTGREVHLYFRSGCGYLTLNEPMTKLKNCTAYFKQARAELLSGMTKQDILFMPTMRLDQGEDQWGGIRSTFTDGRRSTAAMAEAEAQLSAIARNTGALLVFEAPKPLLPSPVYRCVDWYMATNPVCAGGLSVPKHDMERQRAPVLAKMHDLARSNASVTIWDPLPTLCPGTTCKAFDRGEPIFLDRHHASLHGNRMLRDRFTGDFQRLFGLRPGTS